MLPVQQQNTASTAAKTRFDLIIEKPPPSLRCTSRVAIGTNFRMDLQRHRHVCVRTDPPDHRRVDFQIHQQRCASPPRIVNGMCWGCGDGTKRSGCRPPCAPRQGRSRIPAAPSEWAVRVCEGFRRPPPAEPFADRDPAETGIGPPRSTSSTWGWGSSKGRAAGVQLTMSLSWKRHQASVSSNDALTAAGSTAPFAQLGVGVLRASIGSLPLNRTIDQAIEHIMGGFDELTLHPDVLDILSPRPVSPRPVFPQARGPHQNW